MPETTNEMILQSIRQMAWQRAKGELDAVLATFWGRSEQHKLLSETIIEFVRKVEDDGLYE